MTARRFNIPDVDMDSIIMHMLVSKRQNNIYNQYTVYLEIIKGKINFSLLLLCSDRGRDRTGIGGGVGNPVRATGGPQGCTGHSLSP